MVESYFFGEQSALDRAGRIPTRACLFNPQACELEDFLVDDPSYMGISSVDDKHDWRHALSTRPRHPKKYVQFLCDTNGDGLTNYRETKGGKDALKSLAWAQVLTVGRVAYARALLLDISQYTQPALQFQSLIQPQGQCATWPPPRNRVLRNI